MRFGQRTDPINNSTRERLSLSVMFLIASDYARPSHGWSNQGLAAALSVPVDILDPIMTALDSAGLVVKTSEERLVPGRDPHRVALTDIVASVRGDSQRDAEQTGSWNAVVDTIVDRIDQAIETELGARTLGELVDESLGGEE
jgi:DNA-binding IscR family transcriptional regulator